MPSLVTRISVNFTRYLLYIVSIAIYYLSTDDVQAVLLVDGCAFVGTARFELLLEGHLDALVEHDAHRKNLTIIGTDHAIQKLVVDVFEVACLLESQSHYLSWFGRSSCGRGRWVARPRINNILLPLGTTARESGKPYQLFELFGWQSAGFQADEG